MKRTAEGLRGTRGQALVELALLLPFIMMLVLGVLEIGRAWQHKQTLTDAAREGARLSVIANGQVNADTVRTRVRQLISAAGFDSNTVTFAWPLGCRWTGCTPQISSDKLLSMELTQPHQFVVIHRLVQLATNGSGTMTFLSASRMRVE